ERSDRLRGFPPARRTPGAVLLGPEEGSVILFGGAGEEHCDKVGKMFERTHDPSRSHDLDRVGYPLLSSAIPAPPAPHLHFLDRPRRASRRASTRSHWP